MIKLNSFVTGTDKWHIENLIDFDFLWHCHPFEKSKSRGFIFPDIKIKKDLGMPLIIDVSEVKEIDINLMNIEKTIFYSEIWSTHCSVFATIAKNIVAFHNGAPVKIKEDFKMI